MTWFRLEDSFYDHPKVTKAGNSAVGLWVRCSTYSARQLLDGRVPMETAHLMGTRRDIDRLSATGLWIVAGDEYLIPDFLEYNPSSDQVRSIRKRDAERKRRQRETVDRDGGSGKFLSRNVSPPMSQWDTE